MDFNPIMTEWAGVSPALKGALQTAGQTLAQGATPPVDPSLSAAPQITPQIKASTTPQDAGPAPAASPMRMADSNPVPSLGAPAQPNIHVLGSSPLGTLQGDTDHRQQLMNTPPAVSQISHRIQGTDFGQNHPMLGKILGGVAQGAGMLGDTLANALPGIGREIPGTTLNHSMQLGQANAALTQDETNAGKEAQTRNQNAEAGSREEEAAEAPQKANDAHDLSQSSQGNLDSETTTRQDTLQNPSLVVGHAHAVDKAVREGRDPSVDPMVQAYEKQIQGLQPKPKPAAPKTTDIKGPDGKVHTMGYDDKTNKFDIDEGESGFKPATTRVDMGDKNLWAVPQPDGTHKVVSLKSGMSVPEGAVSLAGLNGSSLPTSADRNRGSLAKIAMGNLDKIQEIVGRRGNDLFGPGPGRVTNLDQIIGSNDPDLVALVNEAHNFSMANAGIHGSRSVQNVRDSLKDLLGDFHNGPQGIKGGLDANRANLQSVLGPSAGGPKEGDAKTNSAGDKVVYKGGKWGPG